MKRFYATVLLAVSLGFLLGLPARSQETKPDIAPIIEVFDPFRIESPASPYSDKIEILEKVLNPATVGDDAVSSVREALVQAFPGLVRIESAGFGYKSWWCPVEMEWVKVCCFGATYYVDLGDLGIAAVHVEDFTAL